MYNEDEKKMWKMQIFTGIAIVSVCSHIIVSNRTGHSIEKISLCSEFRGNCYEVEAISSPTTGAIDKFFLSKENVLVTIVDGDCEKTVSGSHCSMVDTSGDVWDYVIEDKLYMKPLYALFGLIFLAGIFWVLVGLINTRPSAVAKNLLGLS